MSKRNKIIYWIATCWLALGLLSTGIVQIIQMEEEVTMMAHLGYPAYFMIIIGVWKILGAIAILIPKTALLKEWAYAGIFFNMTGAIISHVALGDAFGESFPPIFILVLAAVSYYFRPESKKVKTV